MQARIVTTNQQTTLSCGCGDEAKGTEGLRSAQAYTIPAKSASVAAVVCSHAVRTVCILLPHLFLPRSRRLLSVLSMFYGELKEFK